jgi:uncharacterized protein (DUF2336 family)
LAGDDSIEAAALIISQAFRHRPRCESRKALFTLAAAFCAQVPWRRAGSTMHSLSLLDELDAALSCGTGARPGAMLARMTDLFVDGALRYSEEQIAVFDDVMARLIGAADAKARAKLAQRLAPIANAPPNVTHRLACDDAIEVAQPVLAQSQRLGESELLAIAGSKSQQHLFAVAQRLALSEALTDALLERGDRDVARSAVSNSGARFSAAGFRMLVERSAEDDALAALVGGRTDIARQDLRKLPEQASPALQASLSAGNIPANVAIEGIMAAFVGGIGKELRDAASDRAAPAAAAPDHGLRCVSEAEIHQYACERNFEETATALSIMCDAPVEMVERALRDPGTQLVLILAKVAGLSATTTKAILTLRAADRAMSADDLEQVLLSFNELPLDSARRVLEFFRVRVKKPTEPTFAPAVAVDD